MATNTAKKKGIHFAWFVLVGVLLMMGLCRGGINSGMGLFFQPISADMHIGVGEVAMMSSISALVTMFWSPFAGRLLDKFDIRIVTIVGVIVQAGCFAALSLVDAVWGFYALAALMAFGSVFVTQLAGPMMINRWFKDKNGLAMGIMMSFVAICSAVLSPVVSSIIASSGWRMGYIVLGVLALVVVIPAALFLFRTPEQKNTLPLGATEEDAKAQAADPAAAAAAAKNLPGLTSKEALKTPTFWVFFIFMVLLTGTLAFASIVPTLAIEAGFDTVTSGFAMTAYMIGTAIAAIVFGTISDKLGPLKATMVACACGIIALVGLIFFRTNLYMFFGSLFFYGCLSATLGVIGPLVLGTLFGQKEFGSIYGIVMMATGIGSMILIPAYGFIYDATGSFTPALILILGFIVVCAISMIMAFKTGKKVQAMWMPKA
ncbi:MFS transporter [Paraeggerthella hominis]|uniref:MFS transporter n=1 Tax=Paraeggerthella hominis TaxID=2897351 RepID=UPI003D0D34DA